MRLGLIGYGTIAQTLLDTMQATGTRADALIVLVRAGTEARVPAGHPAADAVHVVTDAAGLLTHAPGLVVECAGHGAVSAHVPPLLEAGTDVVVVSVGALADAALHDRLTGAATRGGARLILPPGAVGGVDILAALGLGGDLAVTYRGTKPPGAWAGTPAEEVCDLAALTGPATIFTGTAREAATAYPKNANVAATLALAGAGFEATQVELVADPAAPGNLHAFEAVSPLGRVTVSIENTPSGNARTSMTTIYSVLRAIRTHAGPTVI